MDEERQFLDTTVPGFKKDPVSGVVINTNTGDYERYLAEKQKLKDDRSLRDDVAMLKREVAELKRLLASMRD